MHCISHTIPPNQEFSSESLVSKLRLIVCDVAKPVCLCVMKKRCINLRVTLFKDKRADQTCTASLIIILRLELSKGGKQLTWSIHISRRSTQPPHIAKPVDFDALKQGYVEQCNQVH